MTCQAAHSHCDFDDYNSHVTCRRRRRQSMKMSSSCPINKASQCLHHGTNSCFTRRSTAAATGTIIDHSSPIFKNSSIYLLGLLTCAVVIVQAWATTSPHSTSTAASRSSSKNYDDHPWSPTHYHHHHRDFHSLPRISRGGASIVDSIFAATRGKTVVSASYSSSRNKSTALPMTKQQNYNSNNLDQSEKHDDDHDDVDDVADFLETNPSKDSWMVQDSVSTTITSPSSRSLPILNLPLNGIDISQNKETDSFQSNCISPMAETPNEALPLPFATAVTEVKTPFSSSLDTTPFDTTSSIEKKAIPTGFTDTLLPATYVAETNLPTDIGHYRIRAYRIESSHRNVIPSRNGYHGGIHGGGTLEPHPLGAGAGLGSEPCVIYCADKPPFGKRNGEGGAKGVPVRIHDQCFTSEVFRSRRCDCKEQLEMSLEYIREKGGAIIYLQQEGRGIGLANKVAAYALQDVGLDTVDANTHLGFPEDARQYGVVPSLLEDMGIESIRLMTNNPRKIERLRALGVDVEGTIPMVVAQANPYNRRYLKTKKERMNHSNFGSILLSESPSSLISSDYPHLELMMGDNGENVGTPNGEERMDTNMKSLLINGNHEQTGVKAKDDGYCFGRESVELAIAAVKRGELIVVVDDETRENEGDFIMAAEMATPEKMAEFIRYSSGVICIAMEGERMDELGLHPMVVNNEDPKGTAFSVSVDAKKKHGITTGISARDRAITSVLLSNAHTQASDFNRPGHIFPLRAKENGVLTRDGHTEAAVDFSRLAGCTPAGLLCEIVSEENPVEMAKLPELKRFCEKRGYILTSIADLQQYRRDTGL